ncbi:MAG: GC-type dockerin domain-anchored protein [Phycisphaerales bacterium]
MRIRSSFVAALGAVVCFAPSVWAQFVYIESDSNAVVEASATNSQTFEFILDEDERGFMGEGDLEGQISAFAGANGGSANASSTYDLLVSPQSVIYTAELSCDAVIGGALSMSANAGAGISAVMGTLVETDVAISGAFVLDQPLPTGLGGPALVDVRLQLLGFSPSNPGEFVNIQYELSTIVGGTENEIRFIDTARLLPDGEYTLIAQATLNAGLAPGGLGQPVDLSGRFVARLDYLDSDGDGLFDTWETDGIDFEMDGIPDLDLPGMGATPDNKDLFVEIDVQTGSGIPAGELESVVETFDRAPVPNPSGVDGIFLHMEVDEDDIPHRDYIEDLVGSSGNIRLQMRDQRMMYFGTVAQRESAISEALIQAKSLVYRYGVVGGTMTVIFDGGSIRPGGMGELPGDDFIVTLQGPREGDVGRTIMHELGHTLGLRHGGGDNTNFKPNYFSVMNYVHALRRPDWGSRWNDNLRFDFSPAALPDVDEFELSESAGIGSDSPTSEGRLFAFANDDPVNPRGDTRIWIGSGAPGVSVDWDVDGQIMTEGYALDANRISSGSDFSLDVHQGHNDWANLYYKVRGNRNFDFGAIATGESTLDPEVGELSFEENEMLNDMPVEYLDDLGGDCPADLNGDGMLNFFDVSAFLTAYNAMDPVADFNGDGMYNFFDVSAFLTVYNAGCP